MVEFKEVDDINFPFEVGVLPRKDMALKFADYLNSKGIKACAKPGFGANYVVLVANERDVSPAKLELLRFGNNPFAKAYNKAAWDRGRVLRKEKSISSGFMSFSMGTYRWTPFSLTSAIELICLVCFLLSFFSRSMEYTLASSLGWLSLENITQDFQIYRVITPIFLHFGFLHIAFNLVMFEAFARPIERYMGAGKLLYLILSIAIVSNCLQFIIYHGMAQNALFGGMSGVVYGIICYMGILSRRQDLPSELKIPPGLLTVSIIFIALGFFMNDVANFCHLGGLAMGLLLALVDFKRPLKLKRG